jgi:hypothetical protein
MTIKLPLESRALLRLLPGLEYRQSPCLVQRWRQSQMPERDTLLAVLRVVNNERTRSRVISNAPLTLRHRLWTLGSD